MAARPIALMPYEAIRLLESLKGSPCTAQRVFDDRRLLIGFGEVIAGKYGPCWSREIGTYYCAWRVCNESGIICGRNDICDDVTELQSRFAAVRLGEFAALTHLSAFDIRVHFTSGVFIDMLCTLSDSDEVGHVFFQPENEVLVFQPGDGWRFARSDIPWPY